MEGRDLRKMSIEEYIALDRASEERFEYVSGEAFAMAGGRPEHAVVIGNVYAALRAALRGKPCLAMNEAQKIGTPRTASFHYPDASVICGPPIRDARDENAFVNPTVLVEVLSPTTADYDRGTKFVHDRSLDTLREYLVVDEAARVVEHHVRRGDGEWLMTERRAGVIPLASIDVTIPLDELWVDVERVKAAASA
jgi:Uma2 family endonuclease